MKKFNMGHGAGSGMHGTSVLRVYGWLWRSWLEALAEIPALRWLGLAALVCAALLVGLALAEGKSGLEVAIDGMIAFLFVMVFPAIHYLLFEIYRHHRSDAIFDSKRLADHIREIAKEEIESNELARSAAGSTAVLMKFEKGLKK